MDKKLDSKDIGLDCGFVVCGRSEDELLQKVGAHIQDFHTMQGFSKDFYNRAMSSIREGACEMQPSADTLLCEACSGTCTC